MQMEATIETLTNAAAVVGSGIKYYTSQASRSVTAIVTGATVLLRL